MALQRKIYMCETTKGLELPWTELNWAATGKSKYDWKENRFDG
jgi:hypothetical protein